MPKQMVTLNDLSGGLNTKFSPRDIVPKELQKADNVIVSNPGVLQSSSVLLGFLLFLFNMLIRYYKKLYIQLI